MACADVPELRNLHVKLEAAKVDHTESVHNERPQYSSGSRKGPLPSRRPRTGRARFHASGSSLVCSLQFPIPGREVCAPRGSTPAERVSLRPSQVIRAAPTAPPRIIPGMAHMPHSPGPGAGIGWTTAVPIAAPPSVPRTPIVYTIRNRRIVNSASRHQEPKLSSGAGWRDFEPACSNQR
jgi:hypothetical protein